MTNGQEAGILLTGREMMVIFPSYLPWRRRAKQAEVATGISKAYSFYCLCMNAVKNAVKFVSKNKQYAMTVDIPVLNISLAQIGTVIPQETWL